MSENALQAPRNLSTAVPGSELDGRIIETILGQSDTVLVFTTTKKELRWTYLDHGGHVPSELSIAVSTFDGLMTGIATSVPHGRKPIAYAQLGKALYNALDAGRADGIDAAFKDVKQFVAGCALHAARYLYVLAFLIAAGLLAGGCLAVANFTSLPPDTALLWRASAAGIGGAAMSVLYRSGTLVLDPSAHRRFLILQGIARGILGGLFGCFIVLACKGELILAFAKDHPLALFPLAAIAGYSERFVPEIMSRLESTI